MRIMIGAMVELLSFVVRIEITGLPPGSPTFETFKKAIK
jgi:hypothetical protein